MENDKNIVDFLKPREREEISDAYFDNMASIITNTNKKTIVKKLTPIYKKPIFWLTSIAAVFIGLIVLRNFSSEEIQLSANLSSPSQSELLAYVDENIDNFEQDLLVKYIPIDETEISELKKTSPNNQTNWTIENVELFEDINKEDVLQYLSSEELTLEDLED